MERQHNVHKIIVPLCFIIFLSVLNGTMFQVAIPDISHEFALLPSGVSWVMTGYILAFAVGALIYGKLADIYPEKTLITLGLLLMNAGSLTGLFARWYPVLLAARLLQAAGGAAIPALAMIVVTRYFERTLRGRVLGIIASTVALAAGLGPVAGGGIAGTFHWRYLFIPSLATVFAIPFLRRYLPDETKNEDGFDLTGALLICGSMFSLLVSVTQGSWWFFPPGAVMLTWFFLHIRRVQTPFVNFSLFVNRYYRNTVIATFLSIGMVFGMMFMVPIMLRDLNTLDSGSIGLVMFPGAMSAVVMGVIGGRISDWKGSVFVVYTGAAFLVSGFLLLSTFAGHPPWMITLDLVVCYTGFAFLQSSLPHTVSIALPKEDVGIGMGIYNLVFFISGAFSTAAIGRLLDLKTADVGLNRLNAYVPARLYSNIYILLASAVFVSAVLFRITFRKADRSL